MNLDIRQLKKMSRQHGSIALNARGKGGWVADKIFIPEGKKKTIAEQLDEGVYLRNENHYLQLKDYLAKLLVRN